MHVIDVDMFEENTLNTPHCSSVREESQTISLASPADKEDSNGKSNGNTQPRPIDKTYAYESSFPRKTTFLVSSNTQDWVTVMRELQKTWAVASQQQKQSNPEPCTRDLNDGEGEKEEGFKMSVMLHIVG